MADLLKVLPDWLETEERYRARKPKPRIFLAMSVVSADYLNQA